MYSSSVFKPHLASLNVKYTFPLVRLIIFIGNQLVRNRINQFLFKATTKKSRSGYQAADTDANAGKLYTQSSLWGAYHSWNIFHLRAYQTCEPEALAFTWQYVIFFLLCQLPQSF